MQINQAKEALQINPYIPVKENGSSFHVDDLHDDQKWIAFVILQKIQDWFTCDDLSTFRPLRVTINGQGGSGKSVLINTITSTIRNFTGINNSCLVAAPTGTAAFNVNGETMHSLASVMASDMDDSLPTENAGKKEALCKKFKDCLVLIFDERSMISTSLLGKVERIVSECALSRAKSSSKMTWGGIPVVIVAGDDYQLGGMGEIAPDCLPKHSKPRSDKNILNGRSLFLEFANTVYKLPKVRRIDPKRLADADLLNRLRIGENVTEKDANRLMNLHLDVIERKHGRTILDKILQNSIHLFFRNDKRIHHNVRQQCELNSEDNPTAVLKPISTSASRPKAVRSHFCGNQPPTALLSRGSHVSLQGRNFFPLWGLHNGACGKVLQIVFDENQNPNAGDLPKCAIVSFPQHIGPAWDKDNPTAIPIPIIETHCKFHCCRRKFCPLELCFARTMHKFQGLAAGPPEEGKPPFMCHSVIIDPDEPEVERLHTGLFYTGVSRGTTLGDAQGLNSAVYFHGPHLSHRRIRQLTLCKDGKHEHSKVMKRRDWVLHLENNTQTNKDPNTETVQQVFQYFNSRISYDDFFDRKMKCAL